MQRFKSGTPVPEWLIRSNTQIYFCTDCVLFISDEGFILQRITGHTSSPMLRAEDADIEFIEALPFSAHGHLHVEGSPFDLENVMVGGSS